MTFAHIRRFALAALAMPLALGLAACDKAADNPETGGLSGEKIAAVAPPAGKVWSDVVVKTPENGYRMGNPDAAIKLIEYGSLTCGHCAEFAETGDAELRDSFVASGRVSFEFRNFIRDPIDLTAAQLTRCGTPESFFPLTGQAFANQAAMMQRVQAAGPQVQAALGLPPQQRGIALAEMAGLTEFFAARGIARDQAAACLADGAAAQALAEAAQKQGEQYDITGTPTFLINGTKFEQNEWPALKARLETMGAR